MIVTRTREELSRALEELRPRGALSLVPTMGFLHAGHLSLVDLARRASATVAVSLFVNPLQFGPAEDFGRYPRDEDEDLRLLAERDADLVFAPEVPEMYPAGPPVVTVDPGRMGDALCGAFRPGHFAGVLTVVAKLFGLFRPDLAVFGAKDHQQAVLIRRMVTDLELGVDVLTAPIVRESDGLAMSSRNAYLSGEERRQAVGLSSALSAVREAFEGGERSVDGLLRVAHARLREFPLLAPQYVELVHAETLERLAAVDDGALVALAAFAGSTRLIDNTTLP